MRFSFLLVLVVPLLFFSQLAIACLCGPLILRNRRTWQGSSGSKLTLEAPTLRFTSVGTTGRRSQSAAAGSSTARRRFSSPITSMFRAPTPSRESVQSTVSRATPSLTPLVMTISSVASSTIPPPAPSILIELPCELIHIFSNSVTASANMLNSKYLSSLYNFCAGMEFRSLIFILFGS